MQIQPFREYRWNQHMSRNIAEAISEVEREAHIRIKCFDKWVQEGRLSWVDAHDRLERLLSAVKLLRDLQTTQRVEEIRGTEIGVNSTPSQDTTWAQNAHAAVDAAVEQGKVIPLTAPEAPVIEAQRKFGA
jgi:hypothetical protein